MKWNRSATAARSDQRTFTFAEGELPMCQPGHVPENGGAVLLVAKELSELNMHVSPPYCHQSTYTCYLFLSIILAALFTVRKDR